jgi:hypothetical protein
VEIWAERYEEADGLEAAHDHLHASGLTRAEFVKHPLNANAPDWFMEQFFQTVDYDNDGTLNLLDIAIAHVHCWLSGRPSGIEVDNVYRIDPLGRTTLDELNGHLAAKFPPQTVTEVMEGIVESQGKRKSAFVTRADIISWLDLLKRRSIQS